MIIRNKQILHEIYINRNYRLFLEKIIMAYKTMPYKL